LEIQQPENHQSLTDSTVSRKITDEREEHPTKQNLTSSFKDVRIIKD
jgi:hypothetical protein